MSTFWKAWDKALDQNPYLVLEIGFTRPTGWMVHVWNAHSVGIKAAPKIIETQSESRGIALRQAGKLLGDLCHK